MPCSIASSAASSASFSDSNTCRQELVSVTPESLFKAAFAARLIAQGQTWADMLQWRNNLSHRYDDALLESGMTKICQDFLPAFVALRDTLSEVDGTDP